MDIASESDQLDKYEQNERGSEPLFFSLNQVSIAKSPEVIHCGLAMQWQSWRFPHDCQLHQDGIHPMMEQVNQENTIFFPENNHY